MPINKGFRVSNYTIKDSFYCINCGKGADSSVQYKNW